MAKDTSTRGLTLTRLARMLLLSFKIMVTYLSIWLLEHWL